MQPTHNLIRKLVPTVVVALVALAAFGAGAAGAQAEPFVPGVTDFPSRVAETQQGPSITVTESGFDWSAAAAGATVATLVLLGAVLLVRTAKRSRVALG